MLSFVYSKRKLEQIKKEERRQFLLKQKSENSKPQSPFQATPVKKIPEVAVKPQQRQEPGLYYENELDSDKDVKDNQNNLPATSDQERHRDEEHIEHIYDNIDGSYINEECKENIKEEEEESDRSDHERRRSKRRKKKRRHKNKGGHGSPKHEDNYESSDENDAPPPHVLEDEDITSRLPPPRKLPPLRGQTTKM